MIQLIKMAYRDLGRNRRRSFFSALALALGLSILLLMASVFTGELRGSTESSIKLSSGHLQVRANTYEDGKTSLAWKDLIEDPDQLAGQIAALDQVHTATPRLFASGIYNAPDETVGLRIVGIDPDSAANAPYRDGLTGGDYLTADDRQGILIGLPLARKFHLQPGDSINLLVNTSDGEIDEQPFTVRGVYSTNTSSLDETTVLMPLAKAQTITRTENHASIVFTLLKNTDDTDAVAAALQSSEYQIVTWKDLNPLLMQMDDLMSWYIYVLYLIVLGITATVIVNTLIMSVYERTREIGILSALGMRSRRIMVMFLAESSLLAVGGIVMGLIIGGLLVLYASNVGFYIGNMGITGIVMEDTIYGYLTVKDAVALSLIAFIVTLLAGFLPAVMASHMEPVAALRGGDKK
jgi:ABC-type lipoprotein release transport system permease subunit